jgi:hypothetical protein
MEPEKETKKRVRSPKKVAAVVPGQFDWGKREFGIIAKAFEAETPEVQAQLIAISSQLQLIKLNLNEQPVVISYLVRKSHSNVTEDDLLTLLNSSTAPSLDILLDDIKTNLSERSNVEWNVFWNNLFLSNCFNLLQWEKLCAYAPYVYNVLVKPVIK